MWSLGATVGPFIVSRFLVELPPRNTATDAVSWTSATSSSVSDAIDVTYTAVTSVYSRSAGILICESAGFISFS